MGKNSLNFIHHVTQNEGLELLTNNNIPVLRIMYIIAFFGYAMQYMLLNNLNIAMPSMIHNSAHKHTENSSSEEELKVELQWNEFQQGIVLGSVYYLLWISHLTGGILTQYYGTKKIMGYSIFIGSIINLILPKAAHVHYILITVVRTIQGFCIGIAFPSIFSIIPYWVPQHHRSKFLTCLLGISFGCGVIYLMGGIIIENCGWEAVFYSTAICGFIWSIAWKFLMFDKPEKHPWITDKEKQKILKYLSNEPAPNRKIPIPWKSILTCRVVYVNLVNQFGIMWIIFFISIYSPKYLGSFHSISSETLGFLAFMPHFGRISCAWLYAYLADYWVRTNKLSVTGVRKLSALISHVLPGFLFIGLAFFEDNLVLSVTLTVLILTLSGTAISGAGTGNSDISPNFGSLLQGIVGLVSNLPGFIIPTVVGYMTLNNDTIEQWQKIFLMTAVISLITGLEFVWLWDSKLQKWNFGVEIDGEGDKNELL